MRNVILKYPALKTAIFVVFASAIIGGPFASVYAFPNDKSGNQCGMELCCCCPVDMAIDNVGDCECQMERIPEIPVFPEAIEFSPDNSVKKPIANIRIETGEDANLNIDRDFSNFDIKFININSPPIFLINSLFLI